jgi:predicted HTH domain antitoxin
VPRPLKDYSLAVRLYTHEGLSVSEVARYFNMSRQSMWMILKRRGCKIRAVGEKS